MSHRRGNDEHNRCADAIKHTRLPGWEAPVEGRAWRARSRTSP
ncbi:DUF6310 domain-containing protein [Corallococcus sp. AS-1-12]|nr:DUF6310 domain-containing protein [Corallococcus sp. AS-1-12]